MHDSNSFLSIINIRYSIGCFSIQIISNVHINVAGSLN